MVPGALGTPHVQRAVVISDTGVPDAHAQRAIGSLQAAGVRTAHASFTPSEPAKSLDTVQRMLEVITAHGLERGQPVVALGGGIIGDMAGFAAASYRRGVPWINCPTTLLSMVDASAGGKTGVNIAAGGVLKKNMAGAFWQPALVLADVSTLSSLPPREFRSGISECVKHALLSGPFGDPDLDAWTRANASRVLARDTGALIELVARNIAVKARVVEGDEREESAEADTGRALLNLGHTFAHAIETLPGVSPTINPSDAPLHHGEAVALGLVAATALSELLGHTPPSLHMRTLETLAAFGLPTAAHGLPEPARVLELMRHDKKVLGGSLRLIVPIAKFECRVIADVPEHLVLEAIRRMYAR